MPVILSGVGHRFGENPWLFRGLDVQFVPGRVYALTGPSGSGKSTLLSLLAKLERPVEGRIHFEGVEKISWVFQNPFGVPRRTALDHVVLPILGRGVELAEANETGRQLLARVRLDTVSDRAFGDLSGGEAQRLMLARGMASNPELLLVDEPTAQLDRRTAAEVDAVLGSVADAATIVVIATHDEDTRNACTDHLDLARLAMQIGDR